MTASQVRQQIEDADRSANEARYQTSFALAAVAKALTAIAAAIVYHADQS